MKEWLLFWGWIIVFMMAFFASLTYTILTNLDGGNL